MVIVEQLVEWRLVGEIKVLGENLPELHFVNHKSHMTRPGLEPGPPGWESSDWPPELWHGPLLELSVIWTSLAAQGESHPRHPFLLSVGVWGSWRRGENFCIIYAASLLVRRSFSERPFSERIYQICMSSAPTLLRRHSSGSPNYPSSSFVFSLSQLETFPLVYMLSIYCITS
jgi:hypothetical protein